MKFFRWLRAFLGAYFWLPCPICGRNFGGFEIAVESLMDSCYSGKCVCKECGDKAKELNRKFTEENPEMKEKINEYKT